MTAAVESIETNIHTKWDAELPPNPTQSEIFAIVLRDLANAMARISVLEKTVEELQAEHRKWRTYGRIL